uniref:Uncharacterized protein n=1 Tax=Rhizophora mucronata TaxID=61149 RepID=A0A2P2MCN2_RHIMU
MMKTRNEMIVDTLHPKADF